MSAEIGIAFIWVILKFQGCTCFDPTQAPFTTVAPPPARSEMAKVISLSVVCAAILVAIIVVSICLCRQWRSMGAPSKGKSQTRSPYYELKRLSRMRNRQRIERQAEAGKLRVGLPDEKQNHGADSAAWNSIKEEDCRDEYSTLDEMNAYHTLPVPKTVSKDGKGPDEGGYDHLTKGAARFGGSRLETDTENLYDVPLEVVKGGAHNVPVNDQEAQYDVLKGPMDTTSVRQPDGDAYDHLVRGMARFGVPKAIAEGPAETSGQHHNSEKLGSGYKVVDEDDHKVNTDQEENTYYELSEDLIQDAHVTPSSQENDGNRACKWTAKDSFHLAAQDGSDESNLRKKNDDREESNNKDTIYVNEISHEKMDTHSDQTGNSAVLNGDTPNRQRVQIIENELYDSSQLKNQRTSSLKMVDNDIYNKEPAKVGSDESDLYKKNDDREGSKHKDTIYVNEISHEMQDTLSAPAGDSAVLNGDTPNRQKVQIIENEIYDSSQVKQQRTSSLKMVDNDIYNKEPAEVATVHKKDGDLDQNCEGKPMKPLKVVVVDNDLYETSQSIAK